MAETDGQERTEAATPKRREEARREGRIPRSHELSSAALLLAGTGLLAWVGGTTLARHAGEMLRQGAGGWLTAVPLTTNGMVALLQQVGWTTLVALAPFLAGVAGLTLLVDGLQARGVVAVEALAPKLERVDPVAGLKRMLSLDAAFNLLKAAVKLVVIGAVAWMVLRRAWPDVVRITGAEVPLVLGITRSLAIRLVLWVGLAFLLLAAADYGFQVWQYEKRMRMTRQEVIQEHRETEGDPAVKARIRQLQRAMMRKRMLAQVATADVVVTNPTHIAVALKYDPLAAPAPIVVAMGERLLAQRIRELAHKAGVPVLENKPLARALFASARVGEAVPPALYVAVAEVIAFIFRRKGASLPAPRGSR